MKKAIVTLIIGEEYARVFKAWFLPGWKAYAQRYGLDVLVIDKPIDGSDRALQRSPAWQKCILHRDSHVSRYDQIAWIDADIRINPQSPNIFELSPVDKISAVDAYATPTREDHDIVLSKMYQKWDQEKIQYIKNLTPQEYHGLYGLKSNFDQVVQTGVIVYSPHLHQNIFEKAYGYEEKAGSYWNYEMRPLSYEILNSGLAHWLPARFNMVWSLYNQLYYPFLNIENTPVTRKLKKIFPRLFNYSLYAKCLEAAFENAYLLHFAGGSLDYRYIPYRYRC